MLFHCNQLVRVLIVEDDYNNFEASTLGIVYTEYNIIPQRIKGATIAPI
jgi:hypothetical protein